MDPNANLQEQEQIIAWHTSHFGDMARLPEWNETRKPQLRELRSALGAWLRGGGFAPDWSKAPNAAKYYGK